jgi:SAM-dependent methyltransferase
MKMQLLSGSRLDLNVLKQALQRPEPYMKSSHRFWDDEYIATQMLQHHLDPDHEAASRRPETIRAEASFIMQRTGLQAGMQMLDLGCGPGLYVGEFARSGAQIAGLDLSRNSIEYARENVQTLFANVEFSVGNYLTAPIAAGHDLITLIYFDFCALSPEDQKVLLQNVYDGLAKDGHFVLDVLTDYTRTDVGEKITVCQNGLWSPDPYVEIYQAFLYQEPKTEGFQYTILDEEGDLRSIRIFHRLFAPEEIRALLHECGFRVAERYRDLAGHPWTEGSPTMALFCRKD